VLGAPPADQARLIEGAIDSALALLPRLLAGETAPVMQLLNTRPPRADAR
jgi:hypothetical protein